MTEDRRTKEELLSEVNELRREVDHLKQLVTASLRPAYLSMLPLDELDARVTELAGCW